MLPILATGMTLRVQPRWIQATSSVGSAALLGHPRPTKMESKIDKSSVVAQCEDKMRERVMIVLVAVDLRSS
jgi:hypothetical protein